MVRIGTVPFLVARPISFGLDQHAELQLTVAPPAELGRLLRAGELDDEGTRQCMSQDGMMGVL